MNIKVRDAETGHIVKMARFVLKNFLLLLFLLALPLTGALANSPQSAITCHCFQDRQFSPDHPQAFDPYLLATVQNRLMAHAFGIERKQIVKAKMGGEQNDGLWVGFTLAAAAEQPIDAVLDSYQAKGDWSAVLRELPIDPEGLESRFLAALISGADEQVLAWAVIRHTLITSLRLPGEILDAEYESGASFQELILAAALAASEEQSLSEVFRRHRQLGSWGALLAEDGLTIEGVERQWTHVGPS